MTTKPDAARALESAADPTRRTPRRALLIAALAINGLTACGGGSDQPPPAAWELTPEEARAAAAVGGLLRLPEDHLGAARAALDTIFERISTWPRSGTQCGISGTQQVTVDGVPWAAELPAGKHALTARFDACTFAGPMENISLNGSVEMVYEGTGPDNVSVVMTANAFSQFGVVVDGPAAYSVERYRRSAELRDGGAMLAGPVTTSRVDFKGGRYESSSVPSTTDTVEYHAVVLEYRGVRYALDGRFVTYANGPACDGEVRITDDKGNLVGRKHCPSSGIAGYELLTLIPGY